MPFIGKTNGNTVSVMGPEFLNQSIVEFPIPFTGQKFDNRLPSLKNLGTIAPPAVFRVRQAYPFRITRIPAILSCTDLLNSCLSSKRRQWWQSGHGKLLQRYLVLDKVKR